MPIDYITHKGRKILYVDLSESKSEKRSLELLEETREAYEKAVGELYVLVNTEGAFINTTISEKMKKYGKLYFRDRAKSRAFVGVSGLKKIIMTAYMKVTGGNLKLFNDLEEAKDYLAAQ
ncbi:MAG: hypothetical protein HRT61_12125 [Ekhidna sp.]|nr:hypothetical protein [Ekhidna sp.]